MWLLLLLFCANPMTILHILPPQPQDPKLVSFGRTRKLNTTRIRSKSRPFAFHQLQTPPRDLHLMSQFFSAQTSSKFRPVEAGYVSASFRTFSGLMTYTVRTVMGRPSALMWSGCSMPREAAMLRVLDHRKAKVANTSSTIVCTATRSVQSAR